MEEICSYILFGAFKKGRMWYDIKKKGGNACAHSDTEGGALRAADSPRACPGPAGPGDPVDGAAGRRGPGHQAGACQYRTAVRGLPDGLAQRRFPDADQGAAVRIPVRIADSDSVQPFGRNPEPAGDAADPEKAGRRRAVCRPDGGGRGSDPSDPESAPERTAAVVCHPDRDCLHRMLCRLGSDPEGKDPGCSRNLHCRGGRPQYRAGAGRQRCTADAAAADNLPAGADRRGRGGRQPDGHCGGTGVPRAPSPEKQEEKKK